MSLGKGSPDKGSLDALFHHADADGSGEVDWGELVGLMAGAFSGSETLGKGDLEVVQALVVESVSSEEFLEDLKREFEVISEGGTLDQQGFALGVRLARLRAAQRATQRQVQGLERAVAAWRTLAAGALILAAVGWYRAAKR